MSLSTRVSPGSPGPDAEPDESASPLPVDFAAIFRQSPNCYMVLDRHFRYVAANDAYLRVTGRRLEELLGRELFEVFPPDPDDPDNSSARQLRESFERVLERGKPDVLALIAYRVSHPEGGSDRTFWSATHTPLFDASGEVTHILQHTVDVTDVHQLRVAVHASDSPVAGAEARLQAGVLGRARKVQAENRHLDEERAHLRRLFDQAPGFMCFLRGRDHVFELANRAYLQLVGHRDILGKPVAEALSEVVSQGFKTLLDRVFLTGEPFVGTEIRVLLQRQPGAPLDERFLDFLYQPIFDPDGQVTGIFVEGHDVTEQKRAQEELARYRDHLEEIVAEHSRALAESEAALRQAQKMEALGKLTGGVAHDFNNLLQVIASNLQLLQGDLGGNERALQRIHTAFGSVERGARLASQLLAFARRQPLEPIVIHPGRLLGGMDELLRRALGERIQLVVTSPADLWNTLVDPNQLENVVLNLALNSRDAMPAGGTLVIGLSNATIEKDPPGGLEAGSYVSLSVRDTGHGMPRDVAERAFEPFFTTKHAGKGTGLGLSMVYGFVKQSGGHVEIHSVPGEGTTVRILLPRASGAEMPRAEQPSGPVVGGSEAILVVEDDPLVRAASVELLGELGYRVFKAPDAQAALAIIQSGIRPDLLFTDVMMPGPMTCGDLVRQAKLLVPDLEVLFTSGYSEDALMTDGRLTAGVKLLRKPYRREDLARTIRHLFRNRQQREMVAPTRTPRARSESPTLRILLVEDDEEIRESGAELMEAFGHRVDAVGSAEEALELLETHTFDLLFTDLTLPGMSGAELVKMASAGRPELRVVIASGYGEEALSSAPSLRALVLPKPYGVADIERTLARVVELPRAG